MPLTFTPLSTTWLAEPSWTRLRAMLPDDRFWTAAGVYHATLAQSIRDEGPTVDAHAYIDDGGVVEALIRCGLLTNLATIPDAELHARIPRARPGGRASHDRATTYVRSFDDSTNTETDTDTSRPRVEDDPVPGLAPAAEPALRWLAANVAYVDPLAGLGRLLGERVAALGSEEVVRRLEVMHREAGLDRGDAAGYVFGISDRFRPPSARTMAQAEQDETERYLERVRQEAQQQQEARR